MDKFNEMVVVCQPKDHNGKYPMWVQVEITGIDHAIPHAHLYNSDKKFITKFAISDFVPMTPSEIRVVFDHPPVPFDYGWIVTRWANDRDENGVKNWEKLKPAWSIVSEAFFEWQDAYKVSSLSERTTENNILCEMSASCHPKDNGGKYPMWIRVEYSNGEHEPPHAHLYPPIQKPRIKDLITKFIITKDPPRKPEHIKAMKGKNPVPTNYAKMIIQWAGDKDEDGLNNWKGLWANWRGLEKTLI